jgi:glycine/D-amino acid oxidase-like deaminating enzyme
MYALLSEAERAGVEVLFNTAAIAAVVEDNRVRGVVAAGKFGAFAVLAKVIIDATGDGDIAAFAGAEYQYGSERDHTVMWYSLAQFIGPGRTQNNFTSMVDVSNIEDYTRAVIVGRRRAADVCHDHGIYIASRETRHIPRRGLSTTSFGGGSGPTLNIDTATATLKAGLIHCRTSDLFLRHGDRDSYRALLPNGRKIF